MEQRMWAFLYGCKCRNAAPQEELFCDSLKFSQRSGIGGHRAPFIDITRFTLAPFKHKWREPAGRYQTSAVVRPKIYFCCTKLQPVFREVQLWNSAENGMHYQTLPHNFHVFVRNTSAISSTIPWKPLLSIGPKSPTKVLLDKPPWNAASWSWISGVRFWPEFEGFSQFVVGIYA